MGKMRVSFIDSDLLYRDIDLTVYRCLVISSTSYFQHYPNVGNAFLLIYILHTNEGIDQLHNKITLHRRKE